ncbi:MAG: thiamine-phosphate kinase [Candidatus Lokiarchaeota archaeon]
MKNKEILQEVGESELINLIENLIYQRTKKHIIRDDCFFQKIPQSIKQKEATVVFNSDMLVSTTDVPKEMISFQIGRKAVIMNISDVIVKGVIPKAIIVSAGFPSKLKLSEFKEIINGIIESCIHYNLDYIGGDINETKEIVLSPTILGFQTKSKIIQRNGMKKGDLLVANGKFGLTGVGFDILLDKKGNFDSFPKYSRSIASVLKPSEISNEGIQLANAGYASSSIDSSDGLARSLLELQKSNPNKGFEIYFNDMLIDPEAREYSEEFGVPLENLIFNGGEEFIHLFTISPKNFERLQNDPHLTHLNLLQIGKVLDKTEISIIKENDKIKFQTKGFEHFEKRG